MVANRVSHRNRLALLKNRGGNSASPVRGGKRSEESNEKRKVSGNTLVFSG